MLQVSFNRSIGDLIYILEIQSVIVISSCCMVHRRLTASSNLKGYCYSNRLLTNLKIIIINRVPYFHFLSWAYIINIHCLLIVFRFNSWEYFFNSFAKEMNFPNFEGNRYSPSHQQNSSNLHNNLGWKLLLLIKILFILFFHYVFDLKWSFLSLLFEVKTCS